MYNCDENEIIKFDADFNEDFDNLMLEMIGNCKRIYFLDKKGFGHKATYANSLFSKSVDLLPQTITHIKFGYSFNHPVDNLPYHLLWLEFGYTFNQSVDMLPHKITYLVFGNDFSQPVNDLPNCLEYVSFGYKFSQSLNCLPDSIIYIIIGCDVHPNNGSLFNVYTNKLPKNLNNLCVYKKNTYSSAIKKTIKSNFITQLNDLVK